MLNKYTTYISGTLNQASICFRLEIAALVYRLGSNPLPVNEMVIAPSAVPHI